MSVNFYHVQIIFLMFCLSSFCTGTTYYVDGTNGNDAWNGMSPAYLNGNTGPVKTISRGVSVAKSYGDIVIVADGIYSGPENCSDSIWHEVSSLGLTIKSENGPANCIIDLEPYFTPCRFRNTYSEVSRPTVDGFTFKNLINASPIIQFEQETNTIISNCYFVNNITGEFEQIIFCRDYSAPEITNCIFTNNNGLHYSVIEIKENAKPIINGCAINNNYAQYNFVGIQCSSLSEPYIINCNVSSNFAIENNGDKYVAGLLSRGEAKPIIKKSEISGQYSASINNEHQVFGIYLLGNTNAEITDSKISDNESSSSQKLSGGIFCTEQSEALIYDCQISGNRGFQGGGIIFDGYTTATVEKCVITSNYGYEKGGGVMTEDDPNVIIKNCLIKDNSSDMWGGGLKMANNTNVQVLNCTIINNSAHDAGGIYRAHTTDCVIKNCIIRDNSPEQVYGNTKPELVNYNNIEGGWPYGGVGNFDSDPCFVNPDQSDYHLKSFFGRYNVELDMWVKDDVNSPCIDSGDPVDWPEDEPTDSGGRINVGYYGGTKYASKSGICSDMIIGDINNNCKVDFYDFQYIAKDWLQDTTE